MRQNLLVGLLFSYSSVIEITVQRTEYIESLSRFPILVLILRKPLNEKESDIFAFDFRMSSEGLILKQLLLLIIRVS